MRTEPVATTMAPMTPDGRNISIYCDNGPSLPLWYVYVAEYPGARYYEKSMPFMTEQSAQAEQQRLVNGGK